MDDDRKKFPRKSGAKPGGPGAGERGPRSFGKDKRPGDKRPGDKPFGGGKRFEKRDGDTASERPKRAFKPRAEGEGGDRPARPFRAGPPRDGDRKPFEKRPHRDGERAQGAERGERREWKPRAEGEGGDRPARPFRAGPPRDGDRKPFEKRPRREGDADRGERREWKPRAEGDGGERKEFPRREGPRSFGSKSHEGQRRSYGMKSHGDEGKKPFRKRSEPDEGASEERIAKRLARAGIASRRDAEELIAAGRVRVNGKKLDSPAFNVSPSDKIEVDGTEIPAIERTRMFLFHKPAGVVTTNRDPEGRKTVFDTLPTDLPRLMAIGRLDINTEGLLLLTNDGGLARVLELPATGWLRRYRVRVHGKVDEKMLAGLKDGIAVDGVFYGAIDATLEREQGTNAWLTMGLREGKNREVKNVLGALGLEVTRLIRISYGPFQLSDLPEGHVLEIKGRMLREQLGDRLVEESGANFDAPVVNQFPNQPVRRTEPRAEPVERTPIRREGERGRIGEGGLIKKRQRREGARDEALDKLSTRPERPRGEGKGGFGDKPAFGPRPERGPKPDRKFGDKPARGRKEQPPIEPPGQRKANVWMAPGARPIGAGRAAAEKAEVEAKRSAKKAAYGKPVGDAGRPRREDDRPRSDRPRGDKPWADKPRNDRGGDKPRGPRPDGGKGAPRGPRGGNADRRR